ncbi:LANO_0C02674g1_1 [Lachancea nothofagi CBS 11611]|uniref:LANO_0C02674g1_1 n=1 Tax=Lachancea nothofagi CBS 11611 TaxID=1266666 RepID=A0A1G4J5M8_9SACH|nr:LANO_0C02674g1_1 [Lachancea nothofagi CBS 11611]
MNLTGEPSQDSSLLTEENLARNEAHEKQDSRRKLGKDGDGNYDNESFSDLSKIDSTTQADLDLDGFCMSSDAETEKMDEETGHVVLSQLAKDASAETGTELAGHGVRDSSQAESEYDIGDTENTVPGAIVEDRESEVLVNEELENVPTVENPSEYALGIETPQTLSNSSIVPLQDQLDRKPQVSEAPLPEQNDATVKTSGPLLIQEQSEAQQIPESSLPQQQAERPQELESQEDALARDPESVSLFESAMNASERPAMTEPHASPGIVDQELMTAVNQSLNTAATEAATTNVSETPAVEKSGSETTGASKGLVEESSAKTGLPAELQENDTRQALNEGPGVVTESDPLALPPLEPIPKLSDAVYADADGSSAETHGQKRPLDESDLGTQFKKPRPPANEVNKEADNDDDNDADEDEDEVEDDFADKADVNDSSTSITPKLVAKKHKPSTSIESHSPMEVENIRLSALKEITEIEHQFAELRQRLYENKLVKLQTETQMCLEGSHPALQNYYQKIDSVRDFKLRRAYQRQRYELECIDKETKATRCCIHQEFQRKVTNLRHDLLVNTTQKWYDINKERREMDVVVPDVNYHVPVKIDGKTLSCITGYAAPAQLRREGDPLSEDLQCEGIQVRFKNNPVDKLEVIVDRMRFNNELSDLEGLKRFFNGFPGAPNLSGLKDSEMYEDLQKMQRSI